MRHRFPWNLKPLSSSLLALLGIAFIIPLALAFQYQSALPGYQYHFPQDHASHPAYKTEWWYYTGHLKTPQGKHYGYELTFFRVGGDPKQVEPKSTNPWNTNNLYASHFALSDESNRQFHYSEKLNRAGLNVAGARTDTYYTWNELWLAEQLGNQMILRADSPDGKQEKWGQPNGVLQGLRLPLLFTHPAKNGRLFAVGWQDHARHRAVLDGS
jgi:predicted secreted hydrolase